LLRSTSCVTLGLLLPQFHSQFLLLGLLSSLISCLSIFLTHYFVFPFLLYNLSLSCLRVLYFILFCITLSIELT
jgi:hypothetical protein